MNKRFLVALALGLAAGAALVRFSDVRAEDAAESSDTIKIVLPKNPVAARYLLRRYSNAELVRIERSEPVYEALLDRQGIDPVYRQEALRELARLRGASELAELLAAVARVEKGSDQDAGALLDLAAMASGFPAQELANQRAVFEKLAVEGKRPTSRQIGYLGLALADGSLTNAWRLASAVPERIPDWLAALPLLPDPQLRETAYSHVKQLLNEPPSDEVRRAALAVVTTIPGHDAETFRLLVHFVQQGTERDAAVAALLRLPKTSWDKAQARPTTDAILAVARQTPPEQRTSDAFRAMVQLGNDLAAFLPAEEAKEVRSTLADLGVRMITLRAVPHKMVYDRDKIYVEAGKPVEIVFENTDIMPHNIVITLPGAMAEVGMAAERMQTEPDAVARHFIPDVPQVLHAMRQLQPYETERLNFTAPDKPGEYPYVCTFPGHWRRMYGVMHVVANLDAVPAEELNPAPVEFEVRRFVRAWKLSDLAPHLSSAAQGRSFENGQKLFAAVSCAACHRMRGEGGQIGPDLTEIFSKKNYTRETLLREILEPSHKIDDQFRTQIFVTADGVQVAGVVVQEDAEALYVIRNPLEDCEPLRILKDEIDEQSYSKVSIMPEGLLNTMTRDEIFDLLMYVESGGDANYQGYRE